MYLDETKLRISELRAITRALDMSTATKLTTRADLVRAIEAWVNRRKG
jgi:hypothetical protein